MPTDSKSNLYLLLIVAILAALYLDWRCNLRHADTQTVRSDTTIVNMPPVTVNIPPTRPIIINQPIPDKIDTGAIIRDFFAKVEYRDSIENDTVKVSLYEQVERNRITARQLNYRLKLPLTTVINQITEHKRRFYVGGGITMGRDCTFSAMPFFAYKTLKERIYMGGYDPIGRKVGVGVLIPIGGK